MTSSTGKFQRIACAWAALSMVLQPALAAAPQFEFRTPVEGRNTSAIREGVLSASASAISFGTLMLGSTASRMVTLKNTGQDSVQVSGVEVGSAFTQSNNCPATLAGGAACSVTVVYQPSAEGSSSALLTVSGSATPLTLPVSGYSAVNTTHLVLSANSVAFDTSPVGTPAAVKQISITNSGTDSASINGVGTDNPSEFTQSNNCATLAPGATCQINAAFTPGQFGSRNANLHVYEQLSGALYSVSLTGTGSAGVLTAASSTVAAGSAIANEGSKNAQVTLSNTGNLAIGSLTLDMSAGDFTVASTTCNAGLAPGANCDVSVRFTPTVAGTRTSTLLVHSNNAGSLPISVTGTGIAQSMSVSASVQSLTFGDTGVGAPSASQVVTFTNTGNVAVPVSSVALSNGSPNFNLTQTCPASLAVGSSCSASVVFVPAQAGTLSGALTLAFPEGTKTVALSGLGTLGVASVSSSDITFAPTQVASSAAVQTVTVTNSGNKALAFSGVGIATGAANFSQSNNCGTVAPGATCSVAVTFTPTAAGSVTGALGLVHDGSGVTLVSLTGIGQGADATLGTPSFAAAAVGQTSLGTATLVNTGIGDLSVGAPTVAGDAFTLSSSSCGAVVPVGNSCTIVVKFSPTSTSASTGALTVPTGAGAKTVSIGSTGIQGYASVSSASMSFALQQTGSTSVAQNLTVTNTGNHLLTLAAVGISAGQNDFAQNNNCASVAVGGTCTISINFTPSVDGARTGQLSLVHDGGGIANVDLFGTGQTPSATLSAVAFPATAVGASNTGTATLTNVGSVSLAVTPPTVASVSGAGYSFVSTTCGTSVAAGASCLTTVRFSPTSTSAATGALVIVTGAGTKTTGLGSTGIQGFASINPSSLTFTDRHVATTSAAQVITVTNTGTNVLTFTGVGISSGTGDYAQSNDCAAVPVGGTCTVSVAFTPSALNARPGVLAFTHNGGGIATVNLAGNGVLPASVTMASFAAGTISTGTTTTFTWATSNAVSATVACTAPAVGTATGLSGSLTVSAATAGTGSCTVTATSSAGTTAPGSANLSVIAAPTVVSAGFTPTGVVTGSSSTFAWNTNGGTTATVACAAPATGAGSGLSGSITVGTSAAGTGTCTVTVLNALSTAATGTANLAVGSLPTIPTLSFAKSQQTTGLTNTLNYTTGNATSATVTCSGAASGSGTATAGPVAVTAVGTGTGTCTVVATNAIGSKTSSASFTAIALPSVAASFSPDTVTTGTSTLFFWSTSGSVSAAVACSGNLSGTASGNNGSMNVAPSVSGTGVCTVTATNAAGSTATGSATLTAVPQATYLTTAFGVTTLTAESSTPFTWTTSGASSATVSCYGAVTANGSGVNGSVQAVAGSTAGTGTCAIYAVNPAGTYTPTRNVTVQVVLPPVITSAGFSNSAVAAGGSVGFNWATANATTASVQCTSQVSGSGSGTSNGISVSGLSVGTGTCTVTATNAAGTNVTAAYNITVMPAGSQLLTVSTSNRAVGTTTYRSTVTITNPNSAPSVLTDFGTTEGATATGTCLKGGALAAGASCTFTLTFGRDCDWYDVTAYATSSLGVNYAVISVPMLAGTTWDTYCADPAP